MLQHCLLTFPVPLSSRNDRRTLLYGLKPAAWEQYNAENEFPMMQVLSAFQLSFNTAALATPFSMHIAVGEVGSDAAALMFEFCPCF